MPYSAFDPQVPRPWKAVRRCPACLYPNDVDANFCQACGSRTCLKKFVVPTKTVDHAKIAKRFQEFNDVFKAKPYQRQKSALERELLDFLASLSPQRDISSCTSEEIVKFLISKDKSGKTVLHSRSCSEVPCNCPTRLAAGSVDSLLGKLRAIFNNLGRLHDSHPVAHTRVKEYLKFIREEQAGKAIVPSQAVPLFFVKFSKLISFLRRSIEASAHLSVVNKYILVGDATFFVVDFFTGDRASDLGRLLANQVFRLKERKGFLLKFTLTKTFRGDTSSPFVLESFTNNEVCPVSWIEYYLSACHFLSIELAGGYMFRTTDRGKVVSSRPFLGSAVNNRLRKHLTGAKIDCGETPHSFRLGLSNTLNMMGCSPEEISRYVGWRNGDMVNHYNKMSTVAGSSSISKRLLSSTECLVRTPISHPSNLQCIF